MDWCVAVAYDDSTVMIIRLKFTFLKTQMQVEKNSPIQLAFVEMPFANANCDDAFQPLYDHQGNYPGPEIGCDRVWENKRLARIAPIRIAR